MNIATEGSPEITVYFPEEHAAAQPRAYLSGSEWAEKYRILTSLSSSVTGPWQNELFSLAAGVMDAITHRNVRRVSWSSGTQNAKTESILNTLGCFMHQSPASMMFVMPEKGDCSRMAKIRLPEMINNTADDVLNRLCVASDMRKDIFTIPFVGGVLYMAWATSVNKLASVPVKYIFLDEIDKYKTIATHGDPLALAQERPKAQVNAKVIEASSPTTKKGAITRALAIADYLFYRYVFCPVCGERFVFNFAELHVAESFVGYNCPQCAAILRDADKPRMLKEAKWQTVDGLDLYDVLEGGTGLHIAFKSSSFYSPRISFTDFWRKSQETKNNPAKRRVFVNGWVGEPFDEIDEIIPTDISDLCDRAVEYDVLPAGICVLTAAVDVQADRLEMLVKGWNERYQSCDVLYEKLWGDPQLTEVWDTLDTFLRDSRFEHACGRSFRIVTAVVDAAYLTKEVAAFCRNKKSRRIYAIRGGNDIDPHAEIYKSGTISLNEKTKVPCFILGTFPIKEQITEWIQSTEDEVGYMIFRKGVATESYFLQLTAEAIQESKKNGREVREWVKIRPRNEVFDLTGYNYVALKILGSVRLAAYAAQVAKWMGNTPAPAPVIKKKAIPKQEAPKKKLNIPK